MKVLFLALIMSCTFLTACEKQPQDNGNISYTNQVAPILKNHCLKCHTNGGPGQEASGLNMDSYATLMAGTKFGPIIIPGDSVNSTLVRLINAKTDPAIAMPHGEMHLLTEKDRSTIATWIDQGARNE